MKEIGAVSLKNYPHVKCLANIFAKFPPSENNHVYSKWMRTGFKHAILKQLQVKSSVH